MTAVTIPLSRRLVRCVIMLSESLVSTLGSSGSLAPQGGVASVTGALDREAGGKAVAGFDERNLNVLIVEDNLHFRTLVRTILETLGVPNIEEARDGAEAIDVLKNFPADLAILDWKMDGVDGIEFVRRIRRHEDSSNRYLPIVMVTGYTEDSLVREARDAGVNDFLAKPISAKSLLSRIVGLLDDQRPYIETEAYFGPDRRRLQVPFDQPERRGRTPETNSG